MRDGCLPAVRSRAVFLIGGYERNDAAGFFRRIGRELDRFRTCWRVDAQMDEPRHDINAHTATASILYADDQRRCQSDLTFLSFDDIVKKDGARPLHMRLLAYVLAFSDYVVSGTMFRFFSTNWRFALYFLYPMLTFLALGWLGTVAYRLVAALNPPGGWVIPAIVGLGVTVTGTRYFARRYFLFHLMDLWSFSREHLHCRRKDMDERLALWASVIEERLAARTYDEVLLVGHSTGGALILDLAYLLAERLDKADRKIDFELLTVGSTSLKVALHPAAVRARERLQTLPGHAGIRWTEFQALTDIINFYKCDPYAAAGLQHSRTDAFPRQFQVRFKHMLQPDAYRRIKRNFFRVHYQFISANSRPYFYDFFMICCGPKRLQEVTVASQDSAMEPVAISREVA